MARPSKSVAVTGKVMSKADKKIREEMESKLKGSCDNLKPESHLTTRQIKIFNFIVSELKASGILSNLDKYLISNTAIIIDRLNECESLINMNGVSTVDNEGNVKPNPLLKVRNDYIKDYYRACNELSLSPQARAKFGNINLNQKKKEESPLLQVLKKGG